LNNHTNLTLVDEETERLYECAIMTDPSNETLRYINDGWFEYITTKKFPIRFSLIFVYRIESHILYMAPIECM